MSAGLPDEQRTRTTGPRAADHALQVYTRPLHPELVPLARWRRVEGATWRARVGLLQETGHLLELVSPGARDAERRSGRGGAETRAIVEVVSPTALELPPSGRVELRRVGASASGAIDDDCGVSYACSWSYEQRDAADYASLHARILDGGEVRGERLVVNRGHPENDGPAPFSAMDLIYDLEAGRLETFVVHAFPADRAFLFVQSSLRAP